jgi:CubicO group peptidase (beta-lactamase class C family)
MEMRVGQGFSGVVLVAQRNQVSLFDGFGELGGRVVRRDDRFWIASSAKQFVATAILLLAQNGRLSVDAPLSTFFPDAPTDKAPITVGQLLSHTSGLGQSYVSEQQSDRRSAVLAMFAEPMAGAPGNDFRYSNSNTQLAVAIVEVISGVSYQDFACDELFARVGLPNTGFAGANAVISAAREPLPERLTHPYWGGQGVYSSEVIYIVGVARLVVEAMFRSHARIGEGDAALGWFTSNSPQGKHVRFTRGNEDFGANSLIYAYNDAEAVIVVLTHAGDSTDDMSWSRRVHRDIEAALAL